MQPGGPVRQTYSYSVPKPHRLFKNSSTVCAVYVGVYILLLLTTVLTQANMRVTTSTDFFALIIVLLLGTLYFWHRTESIEYRGPDFLAVVWFVSSPIPTTPLSAVSMTGDTYCRKTEKERQVANERGGGGGGGPKSPIIGRSSINIQYSLPAKIYGTLPCLRGRRLSRNRTVGRRARQAPAHWARSSKVRRARMYRTRAAHRHYIK